MSPYVSTKENGVWGKTGTVRSRDVLEILWPGVLAEHQGQPTRAQLRVAQGLARLVREGRAVRYRDRYRSSGNLYSIPGAKVNTSWITGYAMEVGDAG